MKSLKSRIIESRTGRGVATLSQEVARRNMFERGTPAVLYDGKTDHSGEVIIGDRGHQLIKTYTRPSDELIPRTWFNVRKYSSSEKKHEKTYRSEEMDLAIDELVAMNVPYFKDGNKLTYWIQKPR